MSAESVIQALMEAAKATESEEYREKLRSAVRALLSKEEIKRMIIDEMGLATREDIKLVLDEIRKLREDFNKMHAEMDKRFEQLYAEMNKRFEEVNKNIIEIMKQIKRLTKEMNETKKVIKSHSAVLRGVIENTAAVSIKAVFQELKKDIDVVINYRSFDPGVVFEKPTVVEIDALILDPPMIIEYTSLLKKEDVEKIVKKRTFLRKTMGEGYDFKMIYLAMNVASDAVRLAEENGVKVWHIPKHARRRDFIRWMSQFFGKQGGARGSENGRLKS